MSDNRIDIGIGVDATAMKPGIAEAKREVQSLGNELGKSVADGSAKAVRSVKDLGTQMGAVAGGVAASSRSLDAYIKKIEVSASTIGMSSRETKLLELSQRGATAAQLQAADAALKTIEAYKQQQAEARKAGAAAATAAAIASASQATQAKSTKLTANEARQLSFQLNDLFVQIASGQSPLTAIIQQGSQLNGTFGGIGGTLRALGTLFTVTRVIIGGVAAAFAAVGYAAIEGHKQSVELAKALALTGNAAGITEGQFNAMAEGIATGTKTSIGSAREALQGLVASGQFSGTALSETAKATQLLSKATGQSTGEIIKQFVSMADGVGKWAETTNKSYHFLTASQVDYIKTLEEQGNQQKAVEVTMQALNSRLGDVKSNVGYLEGGWNMLKTSAMNAWDAMLGIGRADTIEGTLTKAKTKLAELQSAVPLKNATLLESIKGAFGGDAYVNDQIASQKSLITKLEESKNLAQDVAKRSADHAKIEQAKAGFMKLQEDTLSKQQKMAKEIEKANALADASGASQVDREKVIANIRDKYKEAKGPASKAPQEAKARLAFDLEEIKKASAAEIDIYTNADKIMEAKRAAQLVDDKQYYAEKMALIQLTSQAQEAALLKEIERMQAESLAGKDKTDNDRKIMDAQAQLAKVRSDAKVGMEVSTIQEKGAVDRITKSYEDARTAAQAYIDTVKKQNTREIGGIGKGQRFRDEQAGISQIEDKQTTARQGLEAELRRKEITKKQFADYLAIVNDTYDKEIDLYRKRTDTIKALQTDGLNGASEAINNYLSSAANLAAQTEDLVGNAIHGLEDAFVQFATTGKLSFGDLARSILADLARIQAKNLIASLLGKDSGASGIGILKLFAGSGIGSNSAGEAASLAALGGNTIGGFADGGRPPTNAVSMVGEHGPELFIPDVAGTIIPNHKLSGVGGGITLSPVTHIQIDSRSDRQQIQSDVQKAVRQGNAELVDQLSRAGKI